MVVAPPAGDGHPRRIDIEVPVRPEEDLKSYLRVVQAEVESRAGRVRQRAKERSRQTWRRARRARCRQR